MPAPYNYPSKHEFSSSASFLSDVMSSRGLFRCFEAKRFAALIRRWSTSIEKLYNSELIFSWSVLVTSNSPRKPSLYVITAMLVARSTTLLPLDIGFVEIYICVQTGGKSRIACLCVERHALNCASASKSGEMFIPPETWLPAVNYALARNATFSTNLDTKLEWHGSNVTRVNTALATLGQVHFALVKIDTMPLLVHNLLLYTYYEEV